MRCDKCHLRDVDTEQKSIFGETWNLCKDCFILSCVDELEGKL